MIMQVSIIQKYLIEIIIERLCWLIILVRNKLMSEGKQQIANATTKRLYYHFCEEEDSQKICALLKPAQLTDQFQM